MSGVIEIANTDRAAFPRAPFVICHKLSDHPLLSLERLVTLALTLPRDQIETSTGKMSVDQRQETPPLIALEPAEIVRQIREVSAWMVLNHVETVPAYNALLRNVLDDVARSTGHADAEAAGFFDIQGFIYVSSAGATTPFHADPGDNFFVQIAGDKFFHMVDNTDGKVMPAAAAEAVISTHANLPYRDEFEARDTVYPLKGGDGCFVPHLWPHWVRTGDGYSISMAITWKSPQVIRANRVLSMNSALRRIGLPQAPLGTHPMLDDVKAALYTAALAVLLPLRRSERLRTAIRAILFGRRVKYHLTDQLGVERKA